VTVNRVAEIDDASAKTTCGSHLLLKGRHQKCADACGRLKRPEVSVKSRSLLSFKRWGE
jgi:hypothetical protein